MVSHFNHGSIMSKLLLLCAIIPTLSGNEVWERPGCHLLGHTRDIYIPGCVSIRVRTNACRGFCTSFSIPSPHATLLKTPNHVVTTRAECCSMASTHDVRVEVRCMNGPKELVFKSAASCACSVCRNG